MTVFLPGDWGSVPVTEEFKSDVCDSCGEPIDKGEPLVGVWPYDRPGRLLHPVCSERVGMALLRDAHLAELASGQQAHLTRRVARLAGAAMTAEEHR